jgi:hypothetical protein
MSATHRMVRTASAGPGVEEWLCPSCGRRVLLRWPPYCEKLVLYAGALDVAHVGGSGGTAEPATPTTGGSEGPGAVTVSRAERDWLREMGVDWDAPAA